MTIVAATVLSSRNKKVQKINEIIEDKHRSSAKI